MFTTICVNASDGTGALCFKPFSPQHATVPSVRNAHVWPSKAVATCKNCPTPVKVLPAAPSEPPGASPPSEAPAAPSDAAPSAWDPAAPPVSAEPAPPSFAPPAPAVLPAAPPPVPPPSGRSWRTDRPQARASHVDLVELEARAAIGRRGCRTRVARRSHDRPARITWRRGRAHVRPPRGRRRQHLLQHRGVHEDDVERDDLDDRSVDGRRARLADVRRQRDLHVLLRRRGKR